MPYQPDPFVTLQEPFPCHDASLFSPVLEHFDTDDEEINVMVINGIYQSFVGTWRSMSKRHFGMLDGL